MGRLSLALAAALVLHAQERDAPVRPPNLVLIVADDLGYGDLGCYGQEVLKTPNLDGLAAGGRRYTQFYAGSTVCAPSRSVLMTGQHTGHTFIRGNAKEDLRPEDVTVAEVLRRAGYRTGCFGKWGLGHEGSDGMPTRQGFERFFGYLDQSHAHNYYPSFLIRDEECVALENVVPDERRYGQGVASEKRQYSHDLIVDAAFAFLDEVAGEPFFLYLPWTLPHANNEAGAAGMEVPDLGEYAAEDWPEPEQGFAAMVRMLDRDVGRLVDYLERNDLAGNTVVLFTSDNGPHHEGGHTVEFFDSNGPLRGSKRDLTEGGIRVPLLVSWPGHVPAGTTSDHVAAFWDLFPTLARLGDSSEELPEGLDGLSFVPDLLGRADQPEHEYLYWAFFEGGTAQAARSGRWKAVQQPYDSPIRLYDVEADLAEQHDVAAAHRELVEQFEAFMQSACSPSERWRFPE